MKHIKIILIIALTFCLNTCKNKRADFFPNDLDKKWTYSISIHSSYKDEKFLKRIMITNVKRVSKGKKIDLSKLYSDGSYYTYEIDKEKKTVIRKSVLLAFEEGIVEPVEKIVYPDVSFKQKKWEVQEQLFLVKGFQPPLRNFKPRSKFNMSYKVVRENFDFRIKKTLKIVLKFMVRVRQASLQIQGPDQ